MKDADRVVYDILLERETLPRDRLDEFVSRLDGETRLEALLFRHGVIDSDQLMEIVRLRDERQERLKASQVIKPRSDEIVFGKAAIARNLAEAEQVRQAMRKALRLRREGRDVSLSQVLVREGVISGTDARDLEGSVDSRKARCDRCDSPYLPGSGTGQGLCPRCHTAEANRLAADPEGEGPPDGGGDVAATHASRETGVENTLVASGSDAGTAAPDVRDEEEGRPFGKYLILSEVARGGMGVVYRARQEDLGRIVALKVLKKGDEASEEDEARFRREAEAMARLSHPNIVAIYDVGEEEGLPYFAMEYLEGPSVDDLILEDVVDAHEAVEIMAEIARGVSYAHERSIIHRDLKPSNVLMDTDGRPRITDFGLAKSMQVESKLTKTGTALGTPYYMAPEQFEGIKDVDHRADIYALGVILYELLTGALPQEGDTPVEVYTKIISEDPVPVRSYNPAIHRDVETICLKALHRDRDQRYQTSAELAEDLERYLAGFSIQAKRPSIISKAGHVVRKHRIAAAVIAAVVLLGAIAGFVGYRTYAGWATEQARGEARRLVAEASQALEADDPTAATQAFSAALEHLPGDVAALRGRARARRAAGDPEGALADLDRLLEAHPEHADALRLRADIHRSEGHWDEAIADLDRLVELAPREPGPRIRRGRAYEEAGQPSEALDDYRRAAGLEGSDGRAALAAGRLLMDVNRGQAIDYLTRSIAADPERAEPLVLRGRLHLRADRPEDAVEDFRRAVDIAPGRADAHRGLADALWATGRREDALPSYREVLRVSDGDAVLFTRMGRIVIEQGEVYEARQLFRQAISKDDELAEAHAGLALVSVAEQRFDRALRELERAIDLDSTLAEAYSFRGQLKLLAAENPESAINDLDRAVAHDPENADALASRGLAYLERGGNRPSGAVLESAVTDLERALDLGVRGTFRQVLYSGRTGLPLEGEVHEGLALCAAFEHSPVFDPREAIRHAEEARDLEARYWSYWKTLAVAHASAEDYCSAARAMEQALQRLPDRSRTRELRQQLQGGLRTYRQHCR